MTDKVLKDWQGNKLKVGDSVMYVTHGPYVHFGVIEKIVFKRETWGADGMRISVRRTWDMYNNNPSKDRVVVLTFPTMFKVGVKLMHPAVWKE